MIAPTGHPPPGDRWDQRRSFDNTLDMMARGKLDVEALISHTFTAEQLPECYARLDKVGANY